MIRRIWPGRFSRPGIIYIRAERYSAPHEPDTHLPTLLPDGKPGSREQELERDAPLIRTVAGCGAFCGARSAFSAKSAPSPGCYPNAETRTLRKLPWDCDFKFGAGVGQPDNLLIFKSIYQSESTTSTGTVQLDGTRRPSGACWHLDLEDAVATLPSHSGVRLGHFCTPMPGTPCYDPRRKLCMWQGGVSISNLLPPACRRAVTASNPLPVSIAQFSAWHCSSPSSFARAAPFTGSTAPRRTSAFVLCAEAK